MTHTSGLKNYTGLDGFEASRHLTQAQFISQIAAHPLDFPPGEKWAYCNTGYNLLGYIIENVSGEELLGIPATQHLRPAGHERHALREPRALLPSRASGYETNRAGQLHRPRPRLDGCFFRRRAGFDRRATWPNGTPALDTDKILTAASRAEMWTPVKLNDGTDHLYGFGWFLEPWQGHANIGHSGSTSGFSASLQRFPEAGLTVILLTNSDEFDIATKLAREIAALEMQNEK